MGYVCTFNQLVAASYLIIYLKNASYLLIREKLFFTIGVDIFVVALEHSSCTKLKLVRIPNLQKEMSHMVEGAKEETEWRTLEKEREREGGGRIHGTQSTKCTMKTHHTEKTRSYGTFKVNVNERPSVINSGPEYVHPLKEVVGLHMTEAIKAGWLTGSSDLWRQQTHKRLFLSASVFGRKGELQQLVTEEMKWAAHNARLFLLFVRASGRWSENVRCSLSPSGGYWRNLFCFFWGLSVVLCWFRNECLHLTSQLPFCYIDSLMWGNKNLPCASFNARRHTQTIQVHSNTITLLGKCPSSIIHGHVLASDCWAAVELHLRAIQYAAGERGHRQESAQQFLTDEQSTGILLAHIVLGFVMTYFKNMRRKFCFIHYKFCKSISYRNIVDNMDFFVKCLFPKWI